ncbi:YhdP family protein [Thalassotalea hakodatensis]|uniref:YhdP family protein n=1 Tax=Thalassotalea hakodatensis TaxID=3030492 RepID=UPI0025726919|nr:YhdP family protein [Thalassotalea hakodatensis]
MMRVSKVSNRWLNRAYKILAILLVIFAVLISSLRLFLPYAHNYRQHLQDYINNTYNSHIVIGNLNMGWLSSGPSLIAENVSVLQTEGAEIYIEAFDVSVDFWRSIKQRNIVTKDLSLNGVRVLFDQQAFANNSTSNTKLVKNASRLFLKQINRFSVQNSQIIYRDEKGERTFLINELYWANNGLSHKAKGKVVLDGLTSNTLQFNMAIRGEKLRDMQGKLYLQANQLNITPWLDKVFAIEDENTHASINFDAWLDIKNGKADQLQVSLGDNQIAWQHQNAIKTLNITQGQLVFDNLSTTEMLHVYSNNILIRTDEQQWQPFVVDVKRNNGGLIGSISQLDIGGVNDLLPLFIEQKEIRSTLEAISPNGQITQIVFQQSKDELKATANFSQFQSQFSEGIPAIFGLSGEVVFHNDTMKVALDGQQGIVDFAEHFEAPITFERLLGNVVIRKQAEQWKISSTDLVLDSSKIKMNAALGITVSPDKDTEMSLVANASGLNVVDAPSLYPSLLMGENLVGYLNSALKKGTVSQAKILFNGPLAKFPFDHNEGIFNVNAELENASFIFNENWPAIQHFAANLNFTNNKMLITGRSGTLNGLDVTGVTASIDSLSHDQVLNVAANIAQADPALVTNLMLTSPLDESVGAVLEQVNVKQNIAATFSLSLPLNDVDAIVAKGNIRFNDNDVALKSPEMLFSGLNGQLTFENEKINTKGLTANWRGMPLSFEVTGIQNPLHYETEINITALWPENAWLAQLPTLMKPYGEGLLAWQGQLVLNNFDDGEFNYHLTVDSTLEGTTLNLPTPFNKREQEITKSKVIVNGDLEESTIDAMIGDQLAFYGKLNHQQINFNQSHLILGDEPMSLPKTGFHVTTALASASVHEWQPFITDLLTSIDLLNTENDEQNSPLLPSPDIIRGNIAQVDLYGEELNGVSFDLADQTSWWQLTITSKEARGEVRIFPELLAQGIDINADYIRIAPEKALFNTEESNVTEQFAKENIIDNTDEHLNQKIFENMPPIRFSCGECQYANLSFGKVDFLLNRISDGKLVIENFVAKRKGNQLAFDASWELQGEHSITDIIGRFNSNDIEREFERLGLSSTVADSGLEASFAVNWLGGPHNFAVSNFNGDIKAELDEGVLKEVPDQARAFSILSLQSLVRKLRFDFRDMFSDGMFYSEIKGDYHIKDGIVYTKNTFMKGAAGDLSVKGNTDLTTQKLDYRMSYQPNVTSSLPAIAWIATLNPVTFLAGVAIDGVITSQVPVEYQFALTGDIAKPNFEQINKKTKHISVGQDSPPQIVENLPEITPEQKIEGVLNPETGLIEPVKKDQMERPNG